MPKFRKILLFVAVPVTLLGGFAFTDPGERYFEIAKNLEIFGTLFREVNNFYVDEVNPNRVMKVGIDAMLKSLDPYTDYIPEDEIEDYRTMTTGQYGGIGAVVGTRLGRTYVIMPHENSPAARAGLKVGDEITRIDDIDLRNKTYLDVNKLLRGQAGTPVKLTVKRYGQEKSLDVSLSRDNIKINSVPYYGMVTGDIGYIYLEEFTMGAVREVKTALMDLKGKGAKKIVLDLRDNPGGLLMEAVSISNLFVPKDAEIVSTKGKVTDWNKTYNAPEQPVDIEIPVAVITSSRSASAAEIVSGVIQDYDRGVLVGQRTYGKGLVQATRPLSYNSQLKVTTAKYYIPSGRCIQAIDYSHRNEDGSVGKIADSLRVAFRTKNGRTVYDGGGISPDVEVEKSMIPPILLSLDNKNLLFEYANKYTAEHPSPKSARDFKMTEAEYQEFVKWLANKDYDYTTQVEKTVEDLIAHAKKEKYYEDIQEQIKALKNKIYHNKDSDLQKFKADVREALEEEIAARYFLEKGMKESSFDNDKELKAAIDVLNDPARYNKLLNRK
ncbi:MAG: S41 family peptidase [Cytophagales bacterium]|jgi:carboxyl-terminal processing protease|nr:S41 family peptidase [Cytophagales bacterium]